MSRNIVLVGFKDSGKTSAAGTLIDQGWKALSFADSLKDCVASIFCWDRELVEGTSLESRMWRMRVDPYWAERLGLPNFTPRWALEHVGTQVMRERLHSEIWVLNTEQRAALLGADADVVFVDGRFPNEIGMVRERRNGRVVRIRRGKEPHWWGLALDANEGCPHAVEHLRSLGVHESEYRWIGGPVDVTIDNDGDLQDLRERVLEVAAA